MDITGTGFSAIREFKVSSYKIDTNIALQWQLASNGDWYATDRGSDNDFYDCTITMQDRYDDIKNILIDIEANRTAGSNTLTLSNFVSDEKIFGADIVYTGSLSATILDFPNIKQRSLNVFTISITLRLLKPYTFTADATIPVLRLAQIGYEAGMQEHTITKYDTYKGEFTYLDENNDSGIFNGTYVLSDTDMAKLRRYQAIQRGANFTISDIPGVYRAFGPIGQGYTIDARLKSITNERMRDIHYWYADLELVNYKVRNA
jgi:hypothetical protein